MFAEQRLQTPLDQVAIEPWFGSVRRGVEFALHGGGISRALRRVPCGIDGRSIARRRRGVPTLFDRLLAFGLGLAPLADEHADRNDHQHRQRRAQSTEPGVKRHSTLALASARTCWKRTWTSQASRRVRPSMYVRKRAVATSGVDKNSPKSANKDPPSSNKEPNGEPS